MHAIMPYTYTSSIVYSNSTDSIKTPRVVTAITKPQPQPKPNHPKLPVKIKSYSKDYVK